MSEARKISLLLVLAFALRAAFRCSLGAADFWKNGYSFFFRLAHGIASGDGLVVRGHATAFRVPLYPALLAAVTFGHRDFLAIVAMQSLIGAGTVWCAALMARQLFGERAAILAALVTAVYPYYVVHDTALQETSLYTFLTAFAVVLLQRVRANGSLSAAAAAGLALGADVLARANVAPFAFAAPFWLLVPSASAGFSRRRTVWTWALCAGALALTLTPWLARSYALTGSPRLTTQSGYFLWLGNNPYTFSRYPAQSIDRSEHVALRALTPKDRAQIAALLPNEAAADDWYRDRALAYMRTHPWQTLGGGFRKLGAGFSLLLSPHRGFWLDLVYLFSYGPILVLGLWGMWTFRRDWREHLLFYALFASFAAVTAVFFGHTSYRAYLDVYWIVFAAGLADRRLASWPIIAPNKIS